MALKTIATKVAEVLNMWFRVGILRGLWIILVGGYSSVFCQSFTSSNLPIIVITTNGVPIQDEPKISADMGIIYNGVGVRNNLTDPFNHYNGKIGIEYRGSSSQSFPKKPYSIELRDNTGVGISVSLLGMPAEEDWVLIASYNDKTLMRDALAYKLSRDLGWYAPRTQFCEVVLNNEYIGVYMLAEKIKRDQNRVNINKLDPLEVSGEDVTGGYIIKIDKSTGNGGAGFQSQFPPLNRNGSQYIYFQYEYPKYDEIVYEQKQYIQNYVNTFETVLKSTTYADPVNGYAQYIDVNSFVDYLIINELSKNVDGYRLSTFMYKDKNGKLSMGPVWDFNLAFGNADYCMGGPTNGWMYNFNQVCNGDWWLIPFWWERFLSDTQFNNVLGERWISLRAHDLSKATIHYYIDSMATVLEESQQRNFSKWPVLGQYVWPNYYVGQTYQQEVSFLKYWIGERLSWLDYFMPKPVVTATENEQQTLLVTAFPNPFVQSLTVQYTAGPGVVRLELFNAVGVRVSEWEITEKENGLHEHVWENVVMAPGMYFLRSTYNQGPPSVQKIVKH